MEAGKRICMSKNRYDFTLCWDCANATNVNCPWVGKSEPVPGWKARHTTIRERGQYIKSYRVESCPMFRRDGEKGGQFKHEPLVWNKNRDSDKRCPSVFPGGVVKPLDTFPLDDGSAGEAGRGNEQTRLLIENREFLPILFAMLERAVDDWKALDYGKKPEFKAIHEFIDRKEVCEFFFSDWFRAICTLLPYRPNEIRMSLHIPENAMEIFETGDEEAITRMFHLQKVREGCE